MKSVYIWLIAKAVLHYLFLWHRTGFSSWLE